MTKRSWPRFIALSAVVIIVGGELGDLGNGSDVSFWGAFPIFTSGYLAAWIADKWGPE